MVDLFISYAQEDRQELVEPLVEELLKHGLSLWYKESEIKLGDSITEKLNEGLLQAQYGLLILSKAFAANHWAKQELNALYSKQVNLGKKYVLPIWYNISAGEIHEQFPLLADYKAIQLQNAHPQSLREVATEIQRLLKRDETSEPQESVPLPPPSVPKPNVRALLQQGDVQQAIEILRESFPPQSSNGKAMILLSAQYHLLQKDFHLGTITGDYFRAKINQIMLALLELEG